MGTSDAPRKENRLPDFKKRFNELRGDMPQGEFALKVGIARATVGFYENGERLPDAAILKQIADRTGVSVDWLLGGAKGKTPEIDGIVQATGLSPQAVETLIHWTEARNNGLWEGEGAIERTHVLSFLIQHDKVPKNMKDILTKGDTNTTFLYTLYHRIFANFFIPPPVNVNNDEIKAELDALDVKLECGEISKDEYDIIHPKLFYSFIMNAPGFCTGYIPLLFMPPDGEVGVYPFTQGDICKIYDSSIIEGLGNLRRIAEAEQREGENKQGRVGNGQHNPPAK